jgi:chorismate mutase-like protein
MQISDWRKKIDSLDSRLIALLNERATFAVEIGKLKRNAGTQVFDPAREAEVLLRITQQNQGPLPAESLQRIFQVIMEETRNTEADHQEETA